ncbi:MAG TPA: aminotransferase class IV, partial [Pseudidiomarina sp.]|nr:aminotransferase class IV [Pseudidiomarina sp.]
MSGTVYLNGQWLPAAEAKVSVFDRGFLFADGVYEVIPVYGGRAFLLGKHLERLQYSLQAIHMDYHDGPDWSDCIAQLIAVNQLDHGTVYLQITRGSSNQRTHLPTRSLQPTVLLMTQSVPLRWSTPEPAKVALLEDIRWHRCDIKSISLLGSILLKQNAQEQHAIEPMLHRAGMITEGAASNYFAVKNDILYTAPTTNLILAGITRYWVLKLVRNMAIEVREEAFSVDELEHLDECFLTSTS